jgi:hypothetical protein
MAWVFNPSNSSAPETILTIGSSRTLSLSNGSVNFLYNSTSLTFGTVSTNAWHHVALSFDGINIFGYLDGVHQVSGAIGALSSVAGTLQIGAYNSSGINSNFFGGTIDEVRIYDHALSQSDIVADTNTPASLPSKLAITSVNGGANPSAGDGFVVMV